MPVIAFNPTRAAISAIRPNTAIGAKRSTHLTITMQTDCRLASRSSRLRDWSDGMESIAIPTIADPITI